MDNQTQSKSMTQAESFKQYFRVEFASTQSQKKQVYGIRYNVYCKEFEYELIDQFTEELEFDDYDKDSLHCLITHRKTAIPAACVRLVPTQVTNNELPVSNEELLPFEKYCSSSLDNELVKSWQLERHTVCEISRLAVDGAFRKRPGELLTRFGKVTTQISQHEQRTFMLIAVAAFLASTALTELTERTNVFAMMEPFLPRLLKRSGINFQRVGKDMDYHGIRAPYFIKTQSALDNMRPELLDLYHWIYEQVETTFRHS
jgi:N-acyl amino acid synthase of PEP-CTERM/exosortase system